MTFKNVTPSVFAGLEKELLDSHQATMTPAPTSTTGVETGGITLGDEAGSYTYTPSNNTLDLQVTKGGNFIKNAILHSKVLEAIDALQNAEPASQTA